MDISVLWYKKLKTRKNKTVLSNTLKNLVQCHISIPPVFYRFHIFHLGRHWRFVEGIFSILPEIQWNKEYEISYKMWNISQSTKTTNFLDACITVNHQTLSTTIFSKPTDAHIYLIPKSWHTEHMMRNIRKSQFLRLRKICSNTSDYIKKSNKYLNFFIKQSYDSSKLKMLAKDRLAKIRDKLLPKNKKKSKRKDSNSYNLTSNTEAFIQNTSRKISSTRWKGHLP